MHQSPEKYFAGRRDKYAGGETGDSDAEAQTRLHRGSKPKARKFPLHEELRREERGTGRDTRPARDG